jgi:CheY-like chemotaxis protein
MPHDPGLADIPVILIPGHQAAQQKAVQLGVAGCLVKPVELEQLLRAVQDIASRSAAAIAPM